MGTGGVLVGSHDVTDWADALEAVLSDRPRRERLSRNAIAHAADFGWGATTERLLGAYADARRTRFTSPITNASILQGIPAAVIP